MVPTILMELSSIFAENLCRPSLDFTIQECLFFTLTSNPGIESLELNSFSFLLITAFFTKLIAAEISQAKQAQPKKRVLFVFLDVVG
jgi:hypothetical protein